MIAWMRQLSVELSSLKTNRTLIFSDSFSINVNGTKMMGCNADSFTVEIENLDYSTIVRIISQEFFNIKISCGYKSSGSNIIFNGSVLYIWNEIRPDRTTLCRILCGPYLIGRYSQRRLNLSMSSGINMYAALKFLLRQAALVNGQQTPNSQIDSTYSQQILDIVNVNSTLSSWIDDLAKANASMVQTVDAKENSILNIYDGLRKSGRVWNLNVNDVILTRGYPQMTASGSKITLLPSVAISPGEVIHISNSIFQVSGSTLNDATNAYYLDNNGMYLVYQVEYSLANRSDSFFMTLQCKARSNFLSRMVETVHG